MCVRGLEACRVCRRRRRWGKNRGDHVALEPWSLSAVTPFSPGRSRCQHVTSRDQHRLAISGHRARRRTKTTPRAAQDGRLGTVSTPGTLVATGCSALCASADSVWTSQCQQRSSCEDAIAEPVQGAGVWQFAGDACVRGDCEVV